MAGITSPASVPFQLPSARRWFLVLLPLLVLSAAAGLAIPSASLAAPRAPIGRVPSAAKPTLNHSFTRTLRVPADYPTIQVAVDAAQSGDLVLVSPGTYHETVRIKTAGITLRGIDRNTTILDGQSTMPNAITATGDGDIVENLTAHNYIGNGFFWSGVTGYRGSYLTAYDNGDYGIYAYNATQGEFDHSYASGNPDSGFYIGGCFPCDALITDVLSENNGLGYSGTNAGGNLVIKNSTWRNNAAGIVPNTLDSEPMVPERGATIVNNEVIANNNANAPQFFYPRAELGVGIGLPGANLNYVANNHIVDQADYGILVSGIFDTNFWLASGNVVEHNRVSGSGIADLALASPSGANDCFADNEAETTLPPLLELTHACGSPLALDGGGDIAPTLRIFARYENACGPTFPSCGHAVLGSPWQTYPAPPTQPGMPDTSAPRGDIFTEPFPLANTLPNGGLPAAVGTGGSGMLQPLGFTSYSIVQLLLSLYGNLVLFALYAVWLTMALWELGHRDDLSLARRFGLGALVVGVPVVGPIIYYFAGGSKMGRGFRLGLVVGAPLLCIVITIILLVIASFTL